MMKPELLAPAGDLERLKVALLYGADAVYIGGTKFSLRSRASNFTLKQIEEAVAFAHARAKKVFVTANIVLHNEDLVGLDEYLSALEAIGIDGVIASSPYVIDRAMKHPLLAIHLSTQQSVTNSALVNFWAGYGVKRVVLARELSLSEIRAIRQKTTTQLEVFIHGGMCASYSGKCSLSNDMTDRDANRGGCAHSCRWNYDLYKGSDLLSKDYDFQMAAKDLQTVRFIPDLMDCGIASLKIEGRMKSLHYIATVVNAYRQVIDDTAAGTLKGWEYYEAEIARAENRETSFGFLKGDTTPEQQIYRRENEEPSQDFVGIVQDYDALAKIATIAQRNAFRIGDTLELFTPDRGHQIFTLSHLMDEAGIPILSANHAAQTVKIVTPYAMEPYDLLRKVQ
jgi:putative protease